MRTLSLTAFAFLALLLGGCPNNDPDDTNDTDDTDTEPQFEATITATLPDAVVAGAAVTVYDADEDEVGTADCSGLVCSLTVDKAGDYTVKAELAGYLLVPQVVEVATDRQDAPANWTSMLGLWGLAPEGQYEDQDGEGPYTVATEYGDPDDYYGYDHFYLLITNMPVKHTLTNDQFEGEDEIGSTVEGTVSTDLVHVNYHVVPATAPAYDRNLTKISD